MKNPMEMTMQEHMAYLEEMCAKVGDEIIAAAGLLEDPTRYDVQELIALARLQEQMLYGEEEPLEVTKERFAKARLALKPLPGAPERIYLWEGRVPTLTDYPENPGWKNNHNPDYRPYLLEVLLPEDVTPVGAIVMVAGGNHGAGTINECYQNCLEFNRLGYQCFILNCRPNHWPWNKYDTAVDAARALRIIRSRADRYRIHPRRVAMAGFSNGGVTVDSCIELFSGEKKVTDYYPDYTPDGLDGFYGAPDAFLCIYGPRYKGMPYNWEGVIYPPTFFAVGRKDFALENLNSVYFDLLEHRVPVEIHTFAGRPHGNAGSKILDGVGDPNFDLWVTHADAFLRDAFQE